MRILTILLLIFSLTGGAQTIRYVDWANGNDANPGTNISLPKKHLEEAVNLMVPGDITYLRAGTHQVESAYKATSQVNRVHIQNKNGNTTDSFYIHNYQDEVVVFDFDIAGMDGSAGDGIVCMKIQDCSYISIKGIRITNIHQPSSGNNSPVGMVLYKCDNSRIRNVTIDNIQGYGLYLQGDQPPPTGDGSDNNHILNVDVYNCADQFTNYEGANGFNITGGDYSQNNIFEGCRAWLCADDGFDNFGTDGYNTYINCWSFANGFRESSPGNYVHESEMDGDGFKTGPASTDQSGNPNPIRTYKNCLAAGNWAFGFDQNAGTSNTGKHEMLNNSAYYNGLGNVNTAGFFFGANTSILQIFKNNASNTGINGEEITSGANVATNSWNGSINLTDADFIEISNTVGAIITALSGARQSDGSLPNINWGKLINGSDLIDAGTVVGTPYNGAAPDIGWFESGTPNIIYKRIKGKY